MRCLKKLFIIVQYIYEWNIDFHTIVISFRYVFVNEENVWTKEEETKDKITSHQKGSESEEILVICYR